MEAIDALQARAPEAGLPEATFTRHVNDAFKSYHSTLALSRSPLADTRLVVPALVRDAVSPTADERGQALRLVLRWAVGRLAPEPPAHPLDEPRPYDDPSWRDPRWWRYTILRHRYLEPLHPDEFVDGGRYTETLIALTGIPSVDSFFDERNRAVREVAAWLRQQLASGGADTALEQMALHETLSPLRSRPAARALLAVAATCEGVFPRALLLRLAEAEGVPGAEQGLAALVAERLLRTDNTGSELWLAPPIRAHLYAHEQPESRQARHQLAARFFVEAGEPLRAAEQWQRADNWSSAAAILLGAGGELVDEMQGDALCEALARFPADTLDRAQGRAVQLLRSDVALQLGRREEALEACRRALRLSVGPAEQAPLYRRLGKLYEQQNQRHALAYYQQAEERFAPGDPELVTLYKDRAWLAILRREWGPAAADLAAALAIASAAQREPRADIYDALASLHRQQGDLRQAVEYAQQALALREAIGSPGRLADSCNNLGLLYSAGGDHDHALAAFSEALTLYRRLGNRERTATTLLNSGMAHHLAGRRAEAVQAYRECLEVGSGGTNQLLLVRAHYNLAEALAELGEPGAAGEHWQAAETISRSAAFDDELRDLEELRERFPALGRPPIPPAQPSLASASGNLDPVARLALAIVARQGQVTPRELMAAAGLSKATATRRLGELAHRGLLSQRGKGRASSYGPPETADPGRPPAIGLAERLLAQRTSLADAGLAAVGWVRGAEGRLLAQFWREPTLASFFTLERRLAVIAGHPVDLLPAEHLGETPLEGVRWVELTSRA
jgi:tetratricopeptide (TPR) repeat protein